jgi:preprotein translocase SecE subunit
MDPPKESRHPDDEPRRSSRETSAPPAPRAGGFLARYKPDQGKYTRSGSLIGSIALVGWGMFYLMEKLSGFDPGPTALIVGKLMPILLASALIGTAYYLLYVKRSTSDFLIATEGEMKKVNWSSRREVIGSTKVVILFTLLLALMIFVVDVGFQQVFEALGVLRR